MTSQLNVDTIVDKAGTGGTNIKVGNDATYVAEGGTASQTLVQGLCKMWGVVDQSSTHVIDDSFNVASVTDNGTGRTQFNFTNDMNNHNYCVLGLTRDGGGYNDDAGLHGDNGGAYDSEKFELVAMMGTSPNDCDGAMWAAVQGDLA